MDNLHISSHYKVFNVKSIILKSTSRLFIFFINIIILTILPTLINAYFINPDVYIEYTSDRLTGLSVKLGASFPFILFIPTFISFVLCFIGNLLFSRKLLLCFKTFIYAILFVLFSINIFLLLNFNTMFSAAIILLIEETSERESLDFITNYAFTIKSITAYIIICLMIIYVYLSEKQKWTPKITSKIYVQLLLVLFISYIAVRIPKPLATFTRLFTINHMEEIISLSKDFPLDCNTITNLIYSIYINHISHEEIITSKSSTLTNIGEVSTKFETNVILVIGESYSKHHSNLYDYPRNTNPQLGKEERAGNLFVFTNAITPYNMTSYVLKNMFSTNSIMERESWSSKPIFPTIFKKSGYKVYFWDNQKSKSDISDFSISSYLYDKEISRISYTDCNKEIFNYDMDLVDSFFRQIGINGKNNLVIFHFIGQHATASNKYPHIPQFQYYNSDSINGSYSKIQKEQIAHYDNATRYNDHVMAKLMNMIRQQECVIVYLSDHGEEIHDFRYNYGRTHETNKSANILKFQYEIPFMIWCSPKYQSAHPDIINNIKNALNKPFMNDNTCQVLFDLAGINTIFYKEQRDLISPSYKPYKKRRIQDNIIYEDVMARRKK